MHPGTAVTPFAPSPSKAEPAPTLERHIGELVAAAGLVIVEALDERANGGLTLRTKCRGGDLICELFRWRKFLIADFPDFDCIARTHGLAALRACDVPSATANTLVDEVLDLLHKVIRVALN
jgi:hypothetical protein